MAAEATPVFNCVRHLLNVWIRAGEPACRRANLAKVRMQPARHGIDQIDHILAVAGQCLLHGAVVKQLSHDRILGGQRLQFPIARGVGQGDTHLHQCFSHLLLRIEIDVRARRTE